MTPGVAFLSLSIGPSTKTLTIAAEPVRDGLLRVLRRSNGQLCVEIFEINSGGSRRTSWSVLSRPIIALKSRPIVFMAKWSDASLFVEVDGEPVASTDPTVTLPPALILTDIKPLNVVEDFSERNTACVEARRELLAQPNKRADRRYPGKHFDLERLHKEQAALSDFLGLVRRGVDYHDLSIGKAVRTLLIPVKGQMGLLQRCAAHLDAQIIVYTINQPSLRIPITPDSMFHVSISGTPEGIFTNPVDIDVWLDLPAAFVAGKRYTNYQFIETIGNTRAAHADPGLHVLVETIEAVRSDIGPAGANRNLLTHTMVEIGAAVASASENLLAEARRRSSESL